MKLRIYTDGGARNNPGPGAIGALICNEDDEELIRHEDCIGNATNNIAEYCALIAGLEIALTLNPTDVQCFLDSELIVKQLQGVYRVKNEHMQTLYQEVKQKETNFKNISYTYLPRNHAKMKIADALVNHALDAEKRKKE